MSHNHLNYFPNFCSHPYKALYHTACGDHMLLAGLVHSLPPRYPPSEARNIPFYNFNPGYQGSLSSLRWRLLFIDLNKNQCRFHGLRSIFFSAQAARFGPLEARPRFSLDRITVVFDVDSPRVIIQKPLMRLRYDCEY